MLNQKAKLGLKICLHLCLQVIFSKLTLFKFLNFAGISFAFSKLMSGTNIFFVTGFYAVSKLFLIKNYEMALVLAYEVIFLALFYFANEFVKPQKATLFCSIFLILSNVLSLYFSINSLEGIIKLLLNLSLQLLTLVFFVIFEKVYKNKLVFYKFGKNDYFAFCVMAMLVGFGIFSFEFIYSKLGLFVMVFLIIFSAKILPTDRFLMCVNIFALSSVIVSLNFELFKLSVILAIFVCIIKGFGKWFYFAMFSIIFAIFSIIFNISNIFSLFSSFFAIFLYAIVPSKFINKFIVYLEADATGLILKFSEEQKFNEVKSKLLIMSNTLKSMQDSFKFLLVGKINRVKASEELSKDIINNCCKECENYKICFTENINKHAMFENMLLKAIENKQISVNDLTNGIQTYCHKGGIVTNEINQMAKIFLSYESAMKTEDESKLIISSELGNFSDIFKNFAKNINNTLKINEKLSNSLKEAFINAMIDIKEALIFEGEQGILNISIVASNEIILRKEISDTISRIAKNQVAIKSVTHLEMSGYSLAAFVPKSKINIQFAISSKAKEMQNGDSGAITKIGENKYFVAIADGMGHGEQANRMSAMVLRLIKSMFVVGLDAELVVSSVNKLLIPAGLDSFTTIDICVVDLDKNECTFIKLGSSVSVLKHNNISEVVSCESLPLGIVQNIKPTIIKKQIFQGDMIFLASDGVVDAFQNVQSFAGVINDAKIYNMQKFLDNIVFDAENLNAKHLDDMTIIGINLLKN